MVIGRYSFGSIQVLSKPYSEAENVLTTSKCLALTPVSFLKSSSGWLGWRMRNLSVSTTLAGHDRPRLNHRSYAGHPRHWWTCEESH
jgi:hypothetical protein